MEWWSGLWLNEGFATWMGWYALEHFFPEWKVWQNFVASDLDSALALDGLRSSHPIEMPMNNSKQVDEIFDAISYRKGASTVRMISAFLGENAFMEGVRLYIKKHAYGSTCTEDLWEALSEASGKDVTAFADIWTKKIGFPVVTVAETGDKIQLEQHRFLLTNDVKPGDDETIFPINLALKTKEKDSGASVNNMLFESRTMDLAVKPDEFFKLNTDHASFYRTAYSPARLIFLAQEAVSNPYLFSVEDRISLIVDANALAIGGFYNASDVFRASEVLKNETNYFVWSHILDFSGQVRNVFRNISPAVSESLKQYRRELAGSISHKLGWEIKVTDESAMQKLKALVFRVAAVSGDTIIVDAAKKMFEEYQAGNKAAVNPNLRSAVFQTAARLGGEQGWTAIRDIYLDAKNEEAVRECAILVLHTSEDQELRHKTYQFALSSQVRTQDIGKCLGVPPTQVRAQELFDFIKQNYDGFASRIGNTSGSIMRRVITVATGSFISLEDIGHIRQFFATKDSDGFSLALEQSYDRIRLKAAWLERDAVVLKKWLAQRYPAHFAPAAAN